MAVNFGNFTNKTVANGLANNMYLVGYDPGTNTELQTTIAQVLSSASIDVNTGRVNGASIAGGSFNGATISSTSFNGATITSSTFNGNTVNYTNGKLLYGTNLSYNNNVSGVLVGNDITANAGGRCFVLGQNCGVSGTNAVNIGYNNTVSGVNAIGIGNDNIVNRAIAIGYNLNLSETVPNKSIALGYNSAVGSGDNNIVIGNCSEANGGISIGSVNTIGSTSLVIGNSNTIGDYNFAIGDRNSLIYGNYVYRQITIGDDNVTLLSLEEEPNSIVVGCSNTLSGYGNILVGGCSRAGNHYNVVAGNASIATGSYNVVIGQSSDAGNDYGIAIGSNSDAGDYECGVAIGASAIVTTAGGIALGCNTYTESENGTSIGRYVRAGANNVAELGVWTFCGEVATRTGGVKVDTNGVNLFTPKSDANPTAVCIGFTHGNEAAGELMLSGLTFRVDTDHYLKAYYNDAGTLYGVSIIQMTSIP